MAITKVMGIETEYGITVPGAPTPTRCWPQPARPPSRAAAAGSAGTRRSRRCATPAGSRPPASPTPAEDDLGLANVILTNGYYYVDHAHRVFVTECLDPRTLVAYDKAGADPGRVGHRAAELAWRPAHPGLQEQHRQQGHLLRHPRELPGRPGDPVRPDRPRPDPVPGQPPGVRRRGNLVRDHHDGSVAFQIAQRSQFFEVEVGLETTLKRPIVNTRDEPHADPERYRRLHVIIGDANMNEVATFLKTGSLAIVLNA